MPPLKGPNGWINVARNNGIGLDREDCYYKCKQNIEATAKWIDYAYDRFNPHKTTGVLMEILLNKMYLNLMKRNKCLDICL